MSKRWILLIAVIVILLLIKRKDMSWRQSLMKTFYPLIMLKGKLFGAEQVLKNKSGVQPPVSFYSLQAVANDHTVIDFATFKGKKVLLVNTASDCGYTGQYEELEQLSKQFNPNLVVIGFPANDFKQQESKDDAAIAAFCKVNYGVTFQLVQKGSVVKGTTQQPVFKWLSDPAMNGWCGRDPVWNFCKYIVNEDGQLVAFFPQTISPLDKEVMDALK